MNDEELIEAMRESFTAVHSQTPVKRIVSRSRAVRARRRIPGVAGALAVAAGAAAAVTTLAPAGHHPGHPATAELAAWTVVKQADGSIAVTIRELRDPAGLQATLRADGIPASVTFFGRPNPACHIDPQAAGLTSKVIETGNPLQRHPRPGNFEQTTPQGKRPASYPVYLIHPSALPHGVGVQLAAAVHSLPNGNGSIEVTGDLVHSSPQCTGS
ncbi:MAG: hypothetical protein ACLP7J_16930 [Streptosporangiaceae bacterium]